MKLYYFAGATCAYKVQLAIAEIGVAVSQIELTRDDLTSEWYMALNSKGVVPTLVDAERVLHESSTIMQFLADLEGGRLYPRTHHDRATMRNWLKLMDEEVFPAMGFMTYAIAMREALMSLGNAGLEAKFRRTSTTVAIKEKRLDAVKNGTASAAVMELIDTHERMLDQIENALRGQPYLAGPDYSLAECAIIPAMTRLEEFGFQTWWTS